MMTADIIALVLVIIGAINWGSIGLFGFDIVAALFGGQTALMSRIIYSLVGLSGIWSITLLFKDKEEEKRPGKMKKAPRGAFFHFKHFDKTIFAASSDV